jgi:hypothetical protein
MCSGGNVDWAMESARSNTRAEQTRILAAMIQLFPLGLDVLYAVDYTGEIDNFNESQWTIKCKNRDVIEGIVFMKIKYKEAGMEFKCFHNRRHPNYGLPRIPQISTLQSGLRFFQTKLRNVWEYTRLSLRRFRISQEGEDGL